MLALMLLNGIMKNRQMINHMRYASIVIFNLCILFVASSSYGTDYTGFWKPACTDNFGVQIKKADSNCYSISFCGPGGCVDPGCWTPNSTIDGDQKYTIISPEKIGIRREDDKNAFFFYTKCTSDPTWTAESSQPDQAIKIKGLPVDSICSELNPRNEDELIKTKKLTGTVVRKAGKLVIKLTNGRTISRADIPCKKADQDLCKWDSFWDYSVYDYFKDGNFLLLEKRSYEYSEYELISLSNGRSLIVQGLPTFSNDNKRFIVNVNPIYDNFVSRLEIWRIEDTKFVNEFTYAPQSWPSVYAKWNANNNEIEIREARCVKDDAGIEKGYALDLIAKMKRDGKTWTVVLSK